MSFTARKIHSLGPGLPLAPLPYPILDQPLFSLSVSLLYSHFGFVRQNLAKLTILCLCLPSAKITVVCYHALLLKKQFYSFRTSPKRINILRWHSYTGKTKSILFLNIYTCIKVEVILNLEEEAGLLLFFT
jgi:hypothetical protein